MSYRYDPELAPAVDLIPTLDFSNPAAARALLQQISAQQPFTLPGSLDLTTRRIPANTGPDVTVQVVAPKDLTTPAPGILWFHGGGFVVGDADGELGVNALIAEALGAVVVSVDYRLAPEHPYPAAVDDGYAALTWLTESANDLGIDKTRIAVGGMSAGGCLAAAVALLSRDRGGPNICFQALDVPVIDNELQTPSMQEFTHTPNWTWENAKLSWEAYLGPSRKGPVPSYAAPARERDLTGLPPAFISACEFDPLRDEAIDYAQRLVQAGVSVELHLYPGTFHGSAAAITGAQVSQRMQNDLVAALGRAFSATAASIDAQE